ncbi:Adenylate kinase 9, partial [Orchesella cincta]
LGLTAAGVGPSKSEVFQYQTEGRQDVDEFETETWSYNDSISRDISRALKFYHGIYSSGIEKLKKSLNRERIGWTPVDTNTGLQMGKHSVINSIIPMLKYRNNVFEDVCRLSFTAAQALLDRGVFTLSRLHRWCPVELSKGNTGINIWNAPGVKKIPYLHRRFIYFLEGEKNAKHFEENTWNLTNQVPPLQPLPLVCMVLGHPKSGKTMLAKKLAQRLGLLYVSGLEAVESVVTHAFVSQWAQALSEVNPSLAAAGHQTMTLANEVLEYMREGRPVPRYILYRCLDLLLMNPKAQCHGVVFDDFPTILDELIEINYREMTPCLVIDLKIPIEEAYSRCDANRKPELRPETVPEESHECMDYLWDTYENTTMETLRWFSEEYQNVHAIDGRLNPEMVYQQAAEVCINGQRKVQEYCINLHYGRPNTLEGTCPLSSTLFHRLTPDFGFFCPVLLNDADELVSVKEISDLSQVVEYKNQIYLFSSRNAVRKFMNNPKRYTVPGCLRTPPSDISQPLMVTPEDFERLKEHWGFMDFDPVLYFANHHYKGLQRGDPKYCVVYRGKLYVFISEDNQKKFMRKPTKYWNLLLPMKIPRKTEPINYDKITPFAYLSAKGMIPILRKLVKLMAEKRPRVQFMNVDQCAALYMGYYLKSQNMNSPFQRRQKYRDAMFKMSTSKSETKDFLNELQTHYGCRQRNLPERLRQKLDDFLKFEHLSTEEKVLIPKIPEIDFGYDALKTPFSEPQVTRKVRRMMDRMKEVDMREKLDAFSTHSKRKKVAEEAAERAAQDAKEAAELARKIEERSQARLKMKSLSGRAKSLALSSVYTSSFGGKTNFS